MTQSRKLEIQYLLTLYVNGEIASVEEKRLFELLDKEKDNNEWATILEELMASEPDQPGYKKEEWQSVIQDIVTNQQTKAGKAVPVRSISQWKRIMVAASVLLVLGIAAYFFLAGNNKTIIPTASHQNDIPAPASNRAMITLADGRKVYLDSAANGSLATQGNMVVTKSEDGKIIYTEVSDQNPATLSYNTLSNPRGSKVVDITLADGSRVWLNAGSSITYPVVFIGNERNVSMNGEAYFEVAPNKSMPFKVSKDAMQVKVLGTHFNVNAYDDERDIKVTLVEGSVSVQRESSGVNSGSAILKPGEQALLAQNTRLTIHTPDLEEVLAWKNGYFNFNRLALADIMRQISRWYDIDVRYEGAITKETFSGIVGRSSNVSQVLKMIEQGGVKFRIEGKSVIIPAAEKTGL